MSARDASWVIRVNRVVIIIMKAHDLGILRREETRGENTNEIFPFITKDTIQKSFQTKTAQIIDTIQTVTR